MIGNVRTCFAASRNARASVQLPGDPIVKRFPLLLLAGALACDSGSAWEGTVENLPNGGVRVTNSARGAWDDDAAWRLQPAFRIGDIEGDGPAIFASIIAIETDDDGRVYVLDRQINELRIFDGSGIHVRTVGRSGGGPGEYSAANGLLWLAPDSLVVVDQRGARYSILTREGDFVRSVPRSLGFFGWVFNGGLHDNRVWERSSVGTDMENRKPAVLGTSLRLAPTEAVTTDAEAAGATRPSPVATTDTILLPEPDAPLFESFSVRNERGGMVMGVPFAPGVVYHLDARGDLWHGHGSAFRFFRSTLAGDTLMEILVEATPVPVAEEELREWESGPGVTRFREMGGRLDMERIPKNHPFFDRITLDADDNIWVSIPAGRGEVRFAVFDPTGRFLGHVTTTGLARDSFVQPVIRESRLYIVGRDDLDVQSVYVFDIVKP